MTRKAVLTFVFLFAPHGDLLIRTTGAQAQRLADALGGDRGVGVVRRGQCARCRQ
jgi:hypothetical protein